MVNTKLQVIQELAVRMGSETTEAEAERMFEYLRENTDWEFELGETLNTVPDEVWQDGLEHVKDSLAGDSLEVFQLI